MTLLAVAVLFKPQLITNIFLDEAYADEAARRITSEAFLASEAGTLFQTGDYDGALLALEGLLETYPGDPLLIRYRAISLDRLGRSEEAIAVFKDLLLESPLHIPTRYFLGQSYARIGDTAKANEEWKWVAAEGKDTPYGLWAERALLRSGGIEQPPPATKEVLRWYVLARYGYEYDSNVILRPSDDTIRSTREQDAGRHVMDLNLRYRAFSRRDLAVDLLYSVRQSLHDSSFNEFNFHSEEFGLNLRKKVSIRNQDFVLGARYKLLVGILEENLFSVRNSWRLSADTRFTPRTRTVFHDRMTVSNFGPDGFDPDRTSRDGFYNDVGFTHYFYSSNFRSYVFLREEFKSAHVRGNNFDFVGSATRLGVHHPIFKRLVADVSTGLGLKFYHNFSSISTRDSSRRRDINWDLYSGLTYYLTSHISLRGFYRFVIAENQNNFFDYRRHISGAQVMYSKSF